ncbi:MAG: hypothetical protein WAV45_04075 [Propionibacteriaceae bacterium]|nr:hypothetical protein [Micropruina sp.]HBX81435.1 hypothetical protein [Propionibacteriaceae bacterium]HBY23917.1 hypothetical protein [Propionibacteriaceae bacterium]
MIHDLEDLVRADLHPAADSLTYEPDLDAIVREGAKTSSRNRWGRGALAVAAVVAVAVVGIQFMNRTLPALPPAPMGQPSDTNPPLNETTRVHVTTTLPASGVDAVMTQDGQSVVFTSGTARVTVPVPGQGRAAWSHDVAPFAAMVINGQATSLRYLLNSPGIGAAQGGWRLEPVPNTPLTVAVMGWTDPAPFDLVALVWGDALGGFHSFTGVSDPVVRFNLKATWGGTNDPITWVVVEDPEVGVIVWGATAFDSGPFDVLATGAGPSLALRFFATDEPTLSEVTVMTFTVLPGGAREAAVTAEPGYTAVDPLTIQTFPSGRQVAVSSWRGADPTPGVPSLSLTYTTADGRQVVLTP